MWRTSVNLHHYPNANFVLSAAQCGGQGQGQLDKDNWTRILEEAFEDLGQLVSLLVIISVMGLVSHKATGCSSPSASSGISSATSSTASSAATTTSRGTRRSAWAWRISSCDASTCGFRRTSNTTRCLNLTSYNYLGFAAADEYCIPRVVESLKKYSASTCGARVEGGTTKLHTELEELVARFVGKPAAVLFGMGYLIGKGGLIISDSLNHNSIVSGARGSDATVRVFQHNSPAHLEKVLREQVAGGQPRTRRAWKKVIVIVEGVYSMEGELCKLPEIIAVCKKYKAYTYLDEAHSFGAVGRSGRGVCELLGVDPADVDIMMGTFTKSFGSCGGYIAASKDIIQHLKQSCPAHLYATSMSPPAVQQVISAIKVILGEDGSNRGVQKLACIRESNNFFRSELKKMGFEVLGDNDSPVMPIMLYNPAKIPAFSRECFRQKVAVITVAFPVTPLLLARARICTSASHTREDLMKALDLSVISRVGDLVGIKYFPAEPPKIAEADAEITS
ncbi:long chain base biosynthesis protein 2a-like [Miscanthus floridulus]|uniref:long chain base biosynthesis protein 2a-like n=1 Tax=Miscanthus floridulus TaxID=154761 RepID=UPI003458222E